MRNKDEDTQTALGLSADRALVDPADDRLGYAQFAERLAESIQSMTPSEGLTIAVLGRWGSGKTTLLNFVTHYLEQPPEAERAVVVRFNPWFFSGHEDLTRRFFDQLQVTLTSRWKAVGKEVPKLLANLGSLVSEAPIPYGWTGKILARLFGAGQRDIYELKRRIADALRKGKKRILVVIDDIDRLTLDEIRQLFRVIRAVADFPNVIYLLAFDREVVTKALAETQGLPGEAYLEKIVQMPFELPLPDKLAIERLLLERVEAIVFATPGKLFDRNYWSHVYLGGIDHFITTPRDVVRLTSKLSVTYPHVKGEVNPVDFIAVEALCVFLPWVYDIIRKNREWFTGFTDGDGLEVEPTKQQAFHDWWIDQIKEEDKEPTKRLLSQLFPKLGSRWSNMWYRPCDESEWRRQLRVCDPERFPVYFLLAVPEGSISNAEMQAILSLAGDKDAFAQRLIDLAEQLRPDGTTRVRAFLEELKAYTNTEIPIEAIPSVVAAFFDAGDQLLRPEDECGGILGLGNEFRIERLLRQLLMRLDEARRFEVLKEAMSSGQAIFTIVREITVLGLEHGKYRESAPPPSEPRIVSAEHLQKLEEVGLEKIRALAADGEALLRTSQSVYIFCRWRDWTDTPDEIDEWILKVTSNDAGQLLFEKQLLQKVPVQCGIGIPRQIIERIRQLSQRSDLTDNQRTLIGRFISEYEQAPQRGDDGHVPGVL